jgi:hypothetical protein
VIYALNPKNYTNYTNYKNNAKINKFKKHTKKLKNQNLKLLNYKYLLTEKNLNFKKQSNKFRKKPKEKICLLPLICGTIDGISHIFSIIP